MKKILDNISHSNRIEGVPLQTLETSDIFRGASLICLGATLSGVRRESGSVNFTFQGESLNTHDMDYRTGRAKVNPLQLRETLNLLRDLIFKPQSHSPQRKENRNERNYGQVR